MAIAQVQIKWAWGAGSEITTTLDSTPTEGNLLVALGRSSGSGIANASLAGWALAESAVASDDNSSIGLWYKIAGAEESKSINLIWASSTYLIFDVAEYGGFVGTPTLDKTAKVDDTGSAVTSRSSGTTDITTVADELCLVAFRMSGMVTDAAATNSFITVSEWWPLTTEDSCYMVFRIVSAVGTYESTLSWTTARRAGALIVTFMGISGTLRHYSGAAWAKGKLMVYNGAAWEARPVKRWDGDSWVDVDGLGG